MIKTMDILALKDLSKSDALWKEWQESRATRLALQPAIRRYTISRVLSQYSETDEADKARNVWGVEDIWYDLDEQSFFTRRAALEALPEWKKAEQEWYGRFDWHATMLVEEIPMLDRTITDPENIKMVKSVAFHELAPGTDGEAIWNFWIEKHGPRHLFPIDTPNMRRYTISKTLKVLEGDAHGIWGTAELWQNYPDVSAFRQRQVPSIWGGREWVTEWHTKFPWSPTVVTEEKVIVKKKSPR